MTRLLYSLTLYLAVPVILLRLYLRGRKAPAYRQRIPERFGKYVPPANFNSLKQTLWIHAVSVGEASAAAPLVRGLQIRYPDSQILVTTMTPTGSDNILGAFNDQVFHCYLPYDLPGAVDRFIHRFNPSLLILMETELWYNLIHSCASQQVKLILANARLSENSAKGYRRFLGFTRGMLSRFDFIAAQAQADADRFVKLGADPKKIMIAGSLKFNVNLDIDKSKDDAVLLSIKESGRTVIIAASTREGEEQKVLRGFLKVLKEYPSVLLILVPRHPERFDSVAKLCEAQNLIVSRRSEKQAVDWSTQVYLGDTMGEMLSYYQISGIAFVGGTLADTGCQNVLEPAALGLPVVVGPSQYNFATICAQLEAAGGLHTVANEAELTKYLTSLIRDPARQRQIGTAARTLVDANKQALPTLLKIIADIGIRNT